MLALSRKRSATATVAGKRKKGLCKSSRSNSDNLQRRSPSSVSWAVKVPRHILCSTTTHGRDATTAAAAAAAAAAARCNGGWNGWVPHWQCKRQEWFCSGFPKFRAAILCDSQIKSTRRCAAPTTIETTLNSIVGSAAQKKTQIVSVLSLSLLLMLRQTPSSII